MERHVAQRMAGAHHSEEIPLYCLNKNAHLERARQARARITQLPGVSEVRLEDGEQRMVVAFAAPARRQDLYDVIRDCGLYVTHAERQAAARLWDDAVRAEAGADDR